jgi:nucleotide-binding universal stress UspA family protein
MRTILAPLDGTELSALILDDAVRLAGPGGTLILTQEVGRPRGRAAAVYDSRIDTEAAKEYLEGVAEGLRARGVSVRTVTRSTFRVSSAIEELARINDVDMIACATHSRGAIGTLLWGSVAWQVVSQSPVPVLLRHPVAEGKTTAITPEGRRILVPLDGSPLAEKALPLAQELAEEWQAPIDLVRVIPEALDSASTFPAMEYLTHISSGMPGKVQQHVLIGNPVEALVAFAQGAQVTEVVMSSHGRTGLARVLLGSVAHDIVHRLPVPVIVVPALAAAEVEQPADAGRHKAKVSTTS